MPLLSAALCPELTPDAAVTLVTTMLDADAPDYGLVFDIPAGYQGDAFAFDSCHDPSLLIAKDVIDQDFLFSRYERFFRYASTASTYYLAPWMGVPAVFTAPDHWAPLTPKYSLTVAPDPRGAPCLVGVAAAMKKHKLRLDCSPGISATWDSRAGLALPDVWEAPDVTSFAPQPITVEITGGTHQESTEYVKIVEVLPNGTDGKTVGKLRILFLDMLTQKAFLIDVTDQGADYKFDRRPLASTPVALESDGWPNYLHGDIISEANTFGFRQIGVTLQLEGDTVDMCDVADHRLFFDQNGLPKSKTVAKLADPPQPAAPYTSNQQYLAAMLNFISSIHHVEDSAAPGRQSKHSRIYLFTSPQVTSGEPGFSYGPSEQVTSNPTKSTSSYESTYPPNVNLQKWMNVSSLLPAILTSREVDQISYKTLVHEVAHSYFVAHSFDYKAKTTNKTLPVIEYYDEIINAHQHLSIYLHNEYINEFARYFDDKKILLKDFKTANGKTLFDDIVSNGMTSAIDSFINNTIFSGSPPAPLKPANYRKSTYSMRTTDIEFLISLNDMVRFTKRSTKNIMDYQYITTGLNSNNNEYYMDRVIIHFDRFQWELIRRALRRRRELVFSV